MCICARVHGHGSNPASLQVLDLVPESWPIELLSGFLVSSLRRIMAERSEMTVAKSLSGAENLQVSARIIEKYEGIGPTVEAAD